MEQTGRLRLIMKYRHDGSVVLQYNIARNRPKWKPAILIFLRFARLPAPLRVRQTAQREVFAGRSGIIDPDRIVGIEKTRFHAAIFIPEEAADAVFAHSRPPVIRASASTLRRNRGGFFLYFFPIFICGKK